MLHCRGRGMECGSGPEVTAGKDNARTGSRRGGRPPRREMAAAATFAWRATLRAWNEAKRAARIEAYLARGRKPWSTGYWDFREAYVRGVLKHAALLRRFALGHPLPKGFGAHLDERVVEYPWVATHLGG